MEPQLPVSPLAGDRLAMPSPRTNALPAYGVPLNPGELLSRAFDLWKAKLGALSALSGIPYLAMVACAVVVGVGVVFAGVDEHSPVPVLIGVGVAGFVALMLTMVAMCAGQAGSVVLLEDQVRNDGRVAGVVEAFGLGFSSVGRFILAYLAFAAISMVLFAPVMGAIGLAAAEMFIPAALLGVLALPAFAVFFYLMLRISAFVPALVIEDLGPIAALRRSAALTRGNVVDVFIAYLVLGGCMMGVNLVTSFLGIIPIIGLIFQLVVSVLMMSYQATFMFLVYAALRDREQA